MSTKIIAVFLSILASFIPFTLSAQTIDDFVNQLRDPSPQLRAKAASELGAG